MSESTGHAVTGGESEIVVRRVFTAPRELVFRAFFDPVTISHWWGPHGFRTTTEKMDAREGGTWLFVMHGPDGTDYKNEIVYREILEPQRLVYDHTREPFFHVEVTFEAEGNNTRLTFRMMFNTPEERQRVADKYGAVEGLQNTLGRLETELQAQLGGEATFRISRELAAPRELVFRAWTEADRLAAWMGPKGFVVAKNHLDLRPGAIYHYHLTGPNGAEMWGKWVFRDIVAPERLVMVSSFSDAEGNTARAPFSGNWPLETLSIIELEALAPDRTRLNLTWIPLNATDEERATFIAEHPGMNRGWSGTIEQLDAYLATL